MTLVSLCAAVCSGLAVFLFLPGDDAGRRLDRLVNAVPSPRAERSGDRRPLPVSVLAGLVTAITLGGPMGWAVGAVVTIVCLRLLSRLEPKEVRIRRARLTADLPLATDLLAACLRGGGAWHESVEAVASAVGGPLGDDLAALAARIRLGADPVAEWQGLAREPALATLGRTAARAAAGGAPVAATLTRLARDQRRTARAAASARARTAGVRAVAPLGLCFLPAFILLGILPAIAGIAANVLLP